MLTLGRVCQAIGYPKAIRVDQGSKFIPPELDLWAYQKDVTLDFSQPGKFTDTDAIEKPHMPRVTLSQVGSSLALVGFANKSMRLGDLLVWDNRCTMHHRNAFLSNSQRFMHKSITQGRTRDLGPFGVFAGSTGCDWAKDDAPAVILARVSFSRGPMLDSSIDAAGEGYERNRD